MGAHLMKRLFNTGDQAEAWLRGTPPRWRRSLAGLLRYWASRLEPRRETPPGIDTGHGYVTIYSNATVTNATLRQT